MGLDWSGDFLQAVQGAFEKEREMLRVELWPQLCGLGPGGCGSLLERLEKVVHEQVSRAPLPPQPVLTQRVTERASGVNCGSRISPDLRGSDYSFLMHEFHEMENSMHLSSFSISLCSENNCSFPENKSAFLGSPATGYER